MDLDEPNCNEPPSFEPEYLEVKAGNLVRYKPDVVDPDSEAYGLEIVVQGRLGTAEVRGKPGLAKIYYRQAYNRASGETKKAVADAIRRINRAAAKSESDSN